MLTDMIYHTMNRILELYMPDYTNPKNFREICDLLVSKNYQIKYLYKKDIAISVKSKKKKKIL
ncbi:MAG: hypothetical protein Ct9H90mP2_09380 [Dehalococcoidia bacterium]|nr:MAG: hypothetical protein Ct9H90mP2_09380 [Dehalococcoidia bacterium]